VETWQALLFLQANCLRSVFHRHQCQPVMSPVFQIAASHHIVPTIAFQIVLIGATVQKIPTAV